ncbi:hypothetical protein CPBF426_00450 [Xanthomonas arboricola pv. juglandis]|nr:hypothetical protein CPBF426_00450 [Xanthomonas arboricola pv. juglandis]
MPEADSSRYSTAQSKEARRLMREAIAQGLATQIEG